MSYVVVVEGTVGSGKTAAAEKIGEQLGAALVLDQTDRNPFIGEFRRDPKKFAFQTQLAFLASRYDAWRALRQPQLFTDWIVGDFSPERGRLYAELLLSEHEQEIYLKLLQILYPENPAPDLIIYLNQPFERLKKKAKGMDESFLESLSAVYNHFFLSYSRCPVIHVDAEQFSPGRAQDIQRLVKQVRLFRDGGTGKPSRRDDSAFGTLDLEF